MILRKLKRILGSQRGFTLIELVVAVVIMGFIGTAVTTTTFQIMKQSVRNRDFTSANQLTMNAIHWISRDAEMSQAVTTGGATGFPLTLSWVDWSNARYQVVYSIADGNLKRSYSVNGGQPVETFLAESINTISDNTSCELATNKVLTLQITATVGEGTQAISVSNMRQIFMRSMP
jgi:prepilin-type N-terminal cleavage/methylation domain-containing protein